MKILLISANRERDPYPVFPIGLAFLAGPLTAAGHLLNALDLCFETDPQLAVSSALTEHQPDAVVISLRNLDNVTWPGSRSYIDGVRDIVAICHPKAVTIIGGSGFSLMPVKILAAVGAHYGVAAEGEAVLPRLFECLESGGDAALIPGVVLPGREDFIPPLPVEAIGSPDRTLFDVARYYREGGMANLQTKRGCPFGCIYCTYPLLEGRCMRLRPIAEIIAEIRTLVDDYGVSYLYFVDDIFNYPTDFAEELCRAISAERLPVNWSAFINPDFITPRLLQAMQEAGCDAVEYGSDSGSPQMLKNLGKSFTVDSIRESSRLCHEMGMDFAHYILFGGPGETRETVLETFTLMDEVEPTAVITMTGIRIYPGTAMEQIALRDGIIAKGDCLLEPVFYISPAIRDGLCDLVTEQALKRRTWIVPSLEVNVSSAMLDALRMFPVKGPLWRLMKRLGRSRVRPI
ncbi:MAG: radical SAM protein [Geobacteraceae bacterium]|nr:radical SAM protein [Geobacteraceae bacterium]NTW80303.1 radical SAM protein [Geobacteraceae bacterium]